MSKELFGNLLSGIVIGLLVLASKGWFLERSENLAKKIQDHELALAKIDATYTDIIRRLDRIERKFDERYAATN